MRKKSDTTALANARFGRRRLTNALFSGARPPYVVDLKTKRHKAPAKSQTPKFVDSFHIAIHSTRFISSSPQILQQ